MTNKHGDARWLQIRVLAKQCIDEAASLLVAGNSDSSTGLSYTYSCLLELDAALEHREPLTSVILAGRGFQLRTFGIWSHYDPSPREKPLMGLLKQLQKYWYEKFATEATKRATVEFFEQMETVDASELRSVS